MWSYDILNKKYVQCSPSITKYITKAHEEVRVEKSTHIDQWRSHSRTRGGHGHPIPLKNLYTRNYYTTPGSNENYKWPTLTFFWSVAFFSSSLWRQNRRSVSLFLRLHGPSFTTQKLPLFLFPILQSLTVHSYSSLSVNSVLLRLHLSTKAQTLIDNCKWKSYWFHIFTLIFESYCLVWCWIWFHLESKQKGIETVLMENRGSNLILEILQSLSREFEIDFWKGIETVCLCCVAS